MTRTRSRSLRDSIALAVLAASFPATPVSAGPIGDTDPPVATITTAAGPGAPVHVRFDENAGPIDGLNIVLEHADGSSIAATRRCRDASDVVVACNGFVRSVRVDALEPFPLGDRISVVLNPDGVAQPIEDAAGNPVASETHVQPVISDQPELGSGVTFLWPAVDVDGASGGSFRTASTPGMTASFLFVGDRVTWVTRTGPRDGLADIHVDGGFVRRLDLSAAVVTLKATRSVRGFGDGVHTVTITGLARRGARGGGIATIVDGFSDERGWFGQEGATYRWPSGRWPGARNRVVTTTTIGSVFRVPFWGGGVDLRVPAGPGFGIADVIVDGTRLRSIDLYRASAGVERRTISGLDAGLHLLIVRSTGRRDDRSTGRRIGLDHVHTAAPVEMFRGLGAWIDIAGDYDASTPASEISGMLSDMDSHGVRTLYLQTARFNSSRAFDYPSRVDIWLREAHERGIAVVGWYLPAYSQFLDVDVARTVAVANRRSPEGERFDAVGVDIEYRHETSGPEEFNAGIVEHLQRVRARIGVTFPVSAIAPPPNQMELAPSTWAGFPWPALGRVADVIQPMAYSSFRKLGSNPQCPDQPRYCTKAYTRNAVTMIREEAGAPNIPIHVIGGVARTCPSPTEGCLTRQEVRDFVDGAEAADAYGASLYDHLTLMDDEQRYEILEGFTASNP